MPKPDGAVALHLLPISRIRLNVWIAKHHRHSKPVVGDIFRVCVADTEDCVRGAACLGQPKARRLNDGRTGEITRVVTDGTPNACSMLYGALVRAAKALGYLRVITYTKADEPGSSLRAAGFKDDGIISPGKEWSVPSRPRKPADFELGPRRRWSVSW